MKLILIIFTLFISGCAQITGLESVTSDGKSWDFDHQVQYDQYKINDNEYTLLIRSTNRTRFSMLSAFLVRQSFLLCEGYGYKIEVLEGVETYNDEKYIKNYIPASLKAKIECSIKAE